VDVFGTQCTLMHDAHCRPTLCTDVGYMYYVFTLLWCVSSTYMPRFAYLSYSFQELTTLSNRPYYGSGRCRGRTACRPWRLSRECSLARYFTNSGPLADKEELIRFW